MAVEFDAHNEMDLREYLARWMPYFRVLLPDRYREYVDLVAGSAPKDRNVENIS